MRYLLDTCSLLWLAGDRARLFGAAQAAISVVASPLHVSVVTLTEIHRLCRKGVITLNSPEGPRRWFEQVCLHHQVAIEPITLAVADAAEALPWLHKDPADRWIVATAQSLDATILTPDHLISQYPGVNVLW